MLVKNFADAQPKRSFEGTVARELRIELVGSRCELRSIRTLGEGKSLLVSPEHTLLTTMGGGHERVTVRVDRKAAYSGPKLTGSGAFFPAGILVESAWPETDLTYLRVSMPHGRLEELAGRSLPPEDWTIVPDLRDVFMQSLLRELGYWISNRRDSDEPLFGECLLTVVQMKILRTFSSRAPAASKETMRLRSALDFIDAHLDRAITLSELCAAAGVSRSQISRAFVRETGMPPHRFIMHRRMLRAKQLLAESDLPITAIAGLVGCANGAHLTRTFQRFIGMSPRAWRHRART